MPDYRLAKRPGSPRWYIIWSEGRRSRRISTGTKDDEQAALILAAFRLERERKPEAKPDQVAVATILNDYITEYASKLPSTMQAGIARDHIIRFYGASTVDALTPSSHDEYEALRRKQRAGTDTINRERSVLRAALNRAHKRGWLASVPHIPSLPKPPPRERFLTRKEMSALLNACRGKSRLRHLALFVRLALYTGARRGAILDLTWDRVDFDNRLIYFPLPGRAHTSKRRAVVPFAGPLYTALERAKRDSKGDNVVTYLGEPVLSIRTAFREACKRAGLRGVTPHVLRHTAATWMVQQGIPIFDVARFLGHSRLATSERYAKHQPEYLRDAMRAIFRPKVRQSRASRPLRQSSDDAK